MPQTIEYINELLTPIKKSADENPVFIVGIDGIKGAGKTYLAKHLQNSLLISHVGLDKYISKNENGSFRDHLDYVRAKNDVMSVLEQKKSVIIEGVLLLEVFDRIQIKPSILIYVEPSCASADNIKEDYERLKTNSLEQIIEYYRLEKEQYPKVSFTLDIEIAEYHKKYNPISRANFIVKTITSN